MPLLDETKIKIFEKACFSRAFEEKAYELAQNSTIKMPIYLSAGQEFISATLASYLAYNSIDDYQIFIQHRGHSTYLSFGGSPEALVLELLGHKEGCANGMGGSASIQSRQAKIYGHDGLMGSHGPIAVGACFANKKFTLCFAGDAAAEEDYFLSALGWASTKNLPIWFIIEDNNLSILTEKRVRRNWEMADVAHAFKMPSIDVEDDPSSIWDSLTPEHFQGPLLLNIRTNRKYWHAGAGVDDPDQFDRLNCWVNLYGSDVIDSARKDIDGLWAKHL